MCTLWVEEGTAEAIRRDILWFIGGFSVSHKSEEHRHETNGHKTSSQQEEKAEEHEHEGTAKCCRSSDERALLF